MLPKTTTTATTTRFVPSETTTVLTSTNSVGFDYLYVSTTQKPFKTSEFDLKTITEGEIKTTREADTTTDASIPTTPLIITNPCYEYDCGIGICFPIDDIPTCFTETEIGFLTYDRNVNDKYQMNINFYR